MLKEGGQIHTNILKRHSSDCCENAAYNIDVVAYIVFIASVAIQSN